MPQKRIGEQKILSVLLIGDSKLSNLLRDGGVITNIK